MSSRLGPGIYYGIPDFVYHADCALEPSLSCSFAQVMLETAPGRAAAKHPRLNPQADPYEPTSAMEEGSALHRLILDAGPTIKVYEFDAWRSKDAKAAKASARKLGMVPVLAGRYEELKDIARRVRYQLKHHPEMCRVLDNEVYASEVTLIWQEDSGCYCRVRVDRFPRHDASLPMVDFKFTDRLKSPLDWDRTVWDSWWDMRAAFYTRGSMMLRDGEVSPYVFCVVEKEPPSDLFAMQLTPHFLAIGESRAESAIDMFERCRTSNEWPGYPRRIFHLSPPAWAETKWMERPPLDMMCPAPARRTDRADDESLLAYIKRDPPNPMRSG